ncbi:MAG: hypothetical protein RI897_712 [Verrucomicrobiota bacterium]
MRIRRSRRYHPAPSTRRSLHPVWLLWITSLLQSPASAQTEIQPLTVRTGPSAGFTLTAPADTGVAFTNHLSEVSNAFNRNLANGSGVALADIDGDGLCDIYFCRLEGDNTLYRNLGNWQFEDITSKAGLACPGQYSTGATFADLNGDANVDLVVNGLGTGTRTFFNDGSGRFTEQTSRLNRNLGAMSSALADIDGDGDLDLYVTNYRTNTWMDRPADLKVEAKRVNGQIVVSPADRFVVVTPRAGGVEVMERGDRDFLYINNGKGQFAPVSWSAAFRDDQGQKLRELPTDWGLSVMLRDFNDDLLPDIYVCNDFFYWPDRFWFNEQSSGFRAAAPQALRNQPVSSMGMDVADINRDGHDDFLVTDMVSRNHAWRHRQRPNMMQGIVNQPLDDPASRPEVPRNTLQLNRGDNTWTDIAHLSGLAYTEWSWGCAFLDVDLDGWEDVLIPTGNFHDVQDADALRQQRGIPPDDSAEGRVRSWRNFPPLDTPVLAYRNGRDLTFADSTQAWGLGQPGPWQGMALADLDNDGDMDIVVNRLNNVAGLFRNDSSAPRVAVQLHGRPPNSDGIGARIQVSGGPVTQSQSIVSGGRYLSSDQPRRTFAAGAPNALLQIEVTWRQGWRTILTNVPANSLVFVEESNLLPPASSTPPPPAWFENKSATLSQLHTQAPVDDFANQPLLSRRLSTLAPGATWFDLDGDGWDDLLLGTGNSDSPLTLLRNRNGTSFEPFPPSAKPASEPSGTGMLLATRVHTNAPAVLLATQLHHSPADATRPSVVSASWNNNTHPGTILSSTSSPGVITLSDVNGDGLLDLFAGSRYSPGHYPKADPSSLLLGSLDASGNPQFQQPLPLDAGMVTSATWADLTGDARPELILATEWGPLRIFHWQDNALQEWRPTVRLPDTSTQPLQALTGWWNSIAVGDFDEDGRLDLIAGNWGRNTRFQQHLTKPLRIYYGDVGNNRFEVLEAQFESSLQDYAPWRDYDAVAGALPWIAEHLPTYAAYGNASIRDVLGEFESEFKYLEAATLDSVVLLNHGDHLELSPLPIDAQLAPVFGISAADFDGDGHADLFLAQNFFSVEPETARYDAGRGLLLRGSGTGSFEPVAGQASGIAIYGQQRGSAVSDYDHDGRIDLLITQHNGETKLYRNVTATPGIRVQLEGPTGNPTGVGAIVQALYNQQPGPAIPVLAGSGYWSQDSSTPLLTGNNRPTAVRVRWPNGNAVDYALPSTGNSFTLHPNGTLTPTP